MTVARSLCDKLAGRDIFANITKTEGHVRVYIKDSESICNLLALLGATKSFYKINNEIAMRSVRNMTNRRTNCDNANIAKLIETATNQIEAITRLKNNGILKTLSAELQQTAKARLENPTANYDELAAILGITKSGVVHRLKRLTGLKY